MTVISVGLGVQMYYKKKSFGYARRRRYGAPRRRYSRYRARYHRRW